MMRLMLIALSALLLTVTAVAQDPAPEPAPNPEPPKPEVKPLPKPAPPEGEAKRNPEPEVPVATPEQLEQIKALIGKLDSRKYPVRESATEELAKLGELAKPALDALVAAKQTSPEARRRAEGLLEQLAIKRWRAQIKGGAIVGGLQLIIRTERASFGAVTDMRFELEIRNTTDKPVPALKLDQLDMQLPHGKSSRSDATGKVTLVQISPKPGGNRWGSRSVGMPAPKPKPLAAGALHRRVLVGTEMLRHGSAGLPKGTYEIHFEMHGKLLGIKAPLKSNVLRFTIK